MDTPFIFEAGRLELDFVNTRFRSDERVVDRLRTPDDLAAWVRAAGLASATTYLAAPHDPATLERARRLRRHLEAYAAGCVASGGRPPEATRHQTAEEIDAFLAARPVVRRLVSSAHGFEVRNEPLGHAIDDLLLPVAESAAALVAEIDPSRVRRCDHPACILYFYDGTRNRSRRWCSMRTCGNRAKVAAFRERREASP